MAKGKASNPADAYRESRISFVLTRTNKTVGKAQRKKELKKASHIRLQDTIFVLMTPPL